MCGEWFETVRSTQVYCSRKCSQEKKNSTKRKELMVKKCVVCGKEFETKLEYAVCCCVKCSQKKYRSEHKTEKQNANCVICGKEFVPLRAGHICCSPECSRKRNYQVNSVHKRQKYADDAAIKRAREAMPKSNHDAIADIAIVARSQGMSYGQYVAKYMGSK